MTREDHLPTHPHVTDANVIFHFMCLFSSLANKNVRTNSLISCGTNGFFMFNLAWELNCSVHFTHFTFHIFKVCFFFYPILFIFFFFQVWWKKYQGIIWDDWLHFTMPSTPPNNNEKKTPDNQLQGKGNNFRLLNTSSNRCSITHKHKKKT